MIKGILVFVTGRNISHCAFLNGTGGVTSTVLGTVSLTLHIIATYQKLRNIW
jgi:hypothetical protein